MNEWQQAIVDRIQAVLDEVGAENAIVTPKVCDCEGCAEHPGEETLWITITGEGLKGQDLTETFPIPLPFDHYNTEEQIAYMMALIRHGLVEGHEVPLPPEILALKPLSRERMIIVSSFSPISRLTGLTFLLAMLRRRMEENDQS